MARPFVRSSSIVLRKYVFSLFRALMLRSHSQLVTPRVQSSFNAVWMFGKNDLSAAFKADAAFVGSSVSSSSSHRLFQQCNSASILSGLGMSPLYSFRNSLMFSEATPSAACCNTEGTR